MGRGRTHARRPRTLFWPPPGSPRGLRAPQRGKTLANWKAARGRGRGTAGGRPGLRAEPASGERGEGRRRRPRRAALREPRATLLGKLTLARQAWFRGNFTYRLFTFFQYFLE